ncbi:hypothetical protein JG687_00012504, partial [Phytophthora cactorum]
MVVEAQNERSTRVDAVLELKKDLDASAARIGAQSAAIQARDQADRTQQARMHQSLIDQGKNPYEVARHKVVQREARKERSRIDRNIQDREAKLLERIEAEKIIQRRREKIEAENRATFTGNAFLANPPMLWFKDFDVNRPFTLGFTLTNVSNTFNQFRLLAMEEEVTELFDIVYEKPGRMSAVFQLPVRCTCKKSVPILAQREVRFPEIVAGERATVTLTLANEGALPLEYRKESATVSTDAADVKSVKKESKTESKAKSSNEAKSDAADKSKDNSKDNSKD